MPEQMRIGIFGGTFDPPHLGHLRAAETAVAELQLDQIYLVLSADPPHKDTATVTAFEYRWRMLTAACQDNPELEPCDLESRRSGPSYTIETVRHLRDTHRPEDELFLLIGSDCAGDIVTWREYEHLLDLVPVVVFKRPGWDPETLPTEFKQRFTYLKSAQLDISSTGLREAVRAGTTIRYLVPDQVLSLIEREGLYHE